MPRRRLLIAAAGTLLGPLGPAVGWTAPKERPRSKVAGPGYADHPAARAFAAEMAERHGLPLPWVRAALKTARRIPAVQQLVMPPPAGTPKNWAAYRARFVEPQRIAAGVAFGQAHRRWLQVAEERFGVPAAIVLGIVGVETYYGRIMGNFRVLDALATLSFDFPPGRSDRSAFFREELEHLLLWTRAEGIEPQAVKGSFAGAIGLGQFMPGSIRRHALDFDGSGHIDLIASAADAIGSIAQFLLDHGWQRGMPTHFAVQPPADEAQRAELLAPDILPSFSAERLAQAGAVLDEPGRAHAGPLALVLLENAQDAPSYVAGTANFYTLTRYNRSSYYALAVIELGMAVAAALEQSRG